jgi:hypothetical protein
MVANQPVWCGRTADPQLATRCGRSAPIGEAHARCFAVLAIGARPPQMS